MEFWTRQLEFARRQIAEIEEKITLQQQKAQQLFAQGADAALHLRLIAVVERSLGRAKAHAQYIEQRIAVRQSEANWQRRRSVARQELIRGHGG